MGLPKIQGDFLGHPPMHITDHILHSQPDPNRFDRDRLFSVVARGVPEELSGLPEYLSRTSKYLTDTEYTGTPAPWPSFLWTESWAGLGGPGPWSGLKGNVLSMPPAGMAAGRGGIGGQPPDYQGCGSHLRLPRWVPSLPVLH